jgi:SAM-dependent methyltransferase
VLISLYCDKKSKTVTDSTARESFFDKWSVYEEMLECNYMFHDEIYRDVQRFLAERYETRLFNVLDLGCGSARHLAMALRGRSVGRYLGYDLSLEALTHARRNLSYVACPVELRQGDLLEGLNSNGEQFDLIFSSFALHHLPSGDKASFFRLAHARLHENGILILVDTMREEDENLSVYLDRYCGWLRASWSALSPEALDAFCDHIRNNDLPETPSELQTMATDAGFARCLEINRFRWHRTLCFEKKAPSIS